MTKLWFAGLLICLALAGCATMGERTLIVPDYQVVVSGSDVYISKYTGKETDVVIPSIIENVTVNYIGNAAFANKELTSVTIPDSVTTIGMNAFYGNQLTDVTIGSGVTRIESRAFANNQLASVIIPENVTSIGIRAFAYNHLTSITIGSGIAVFGADAFGGNQLASVTLPEGLMLNGDLFFYSDFHAYYKNTFNRQSGTYTRQGRAWARDGVAAAQGAFIRTGYGVSIEKIDGEYPADYQYATGRYMVPTGLHDIELSYFDYKKYLEGTVTSNEQYRFEGGIYMITGTPEEDNKVAFRIQRQQQ
jgi:hypothetical protein